MKKPIDITLTPKGFEKIKKEKQDHLERRPGVVKRMSAAREQGDLSENAGYHAAKEELGRIDSRLRELDLIIRFADVVESEKQDGVSIGNKVTVKIGDGSMDYTVVGELEADPAKGRVSNVSPIGKALIGKKVGEKVEFDSPGGKTNIEIVNIEV
jgi:transcription elongation factor GreA